MPSEDDIRTLVSRIVSEVAPDQQPDSKGPTAPQASQATAIDIAIGSDHGGFPLKERLGFRLKEHGYAVHDCGTDAAEPVDYPDYAHAVAKLVSDGVCQWGVIVDGAGIGSCMVANKLPGVRAALCYDISTARNSREHNHANVLTLGAGLIGEALAWQILEAWLGTPWGSGRHARRVEKITEIERRYLQDRAAGGGP